MIYLFKFLIGWIAVIIITVIVLLVRTLTWEWDDEITEPKEVYRSIVGESTWNAMHLKNLK